MRISVIIPTLNESDNIREAIATARQATGVKVIVSDGGSGDGTADIARSCGAKTLCTTPGRARQMNAGAEAATGEALLFLHADTRLPRDYARLVRETLRRRNVVAGAFTLSIDSEKKGLRIIEWLTDVRTREFLMPYGDQAIFIKASVFKDLGGFPDIPIMEDFELVRRAKKAGRIVILKEKVVTSARRWLRNGVLRTTLINQLILFGYMVRVPLARLARLYR